VAFSVQKLSETGQDKTKVAIEVLYIYIGSHIHAFDSAKINDLELP